MKKYDHARIKCEDRLVWHIKQDNNPSDKTQTILLRLKQFFVFWSPWLSQFSIDLDQSKLNHEIRFIDVC